MQIQLVDLFLRDEFIDLNYPLVLDSNRLDSLIFSAAAISAMVACVPRSATGDRPDHGVGRSVARTPPRYRL